MVTEENQNPTKGEALPLAQDNNIPWIDYAMQQAQIAQTTIQTTLDDAFTASKSRLHSILATSSAHFHQTIDSLQDLKSDYTGYEDIVFDKVKEGVVIAAAHPLITTGTLLGVGFLGLKGPRRYLYYNAMRLLVSEEALLSRADAKVKDLRQTIELLKIESAKLEKSASQAEEELIRGRTKLRQAGKQIRSVINSAYKIERQGEGLKDVLRELPRREASLFRSQVTNLAKEAKQERSVLTKEVTKISNYGISV